MKNTKSHFLVLLSSTILGTLGVVSIASAASIIGTDISTAGTLTVGPGESGLPAALQGYAGGQIFVTTTDQVSGVAVEAYDPTAGNIALWGVSSSGNSFTEGVEGDGIVTANGQDAYGVVAMPTAGAGVAAGNLYSFYTNPPGFALGSSAINAYGLYLSDVTGATNNYAIKTGLGVSQFGDHASFGVGATPNQNSNFGDFGDGFPGILTVFESNSTARTGILSELQIGQATAGDVSEYGTENGVYILPSRSSALNYIIGSYIAAYHGGTGLVNNLQGIEADAETLDSEDGGGGGASVGDIAGSVSMTRVDTGTSANTVVDFEADSRVIDGTVSGSATGLQIASLSGSGTVPNNYGIQIADQNFAGANNYAIKTGLGKVVFGDKVGIGTTTPQTQLQVSSGASATTTVTIGELGLTSSKGCVNINRPNGQPGSFYLNTAGNGIVVEPNYCR